MPIAAVAAYFKEDKAWGSLFSFPLNSESLGLSCRHPANTTTCAAIGAKLSRGRFARGSSERGWENCLIAIVIQWKVFSGLGVISL